ncbi:MAG: hypothetical protein R3B13_08065 [Polyangiaceae bacterium]
MPGAPEPEPMAASSTLRRARWLGVAALALTTILIAWTAVGGILQRSGEPAVPLDDTFIHFQYAKRFAELHPLRYSPNADPAPGATSLLWPLTLAPFWAAGFRDVALIWPAWILGFLALFATAWETWRLGRRLLSEGVAFVAGASVLTFGGLIWGAGSGMEIAPFAWWIVTTTRRCADWHDARDSTASTRELAALLLFGALAPCVRPEGVLFTAAAGATLLIAPRGRHRAFAALILAGALLPGFVNWGLTGTAQSTTAAVKWLPNLPYYRGSVLVGAVLGNVRLLFGTLLNGEAWSAVFIPSGAGWVAWCALPALVVLSVLRRETFRGALIVLLALGMLVPTTYDSFLWNRLRYLWPFAPGWLLAVAALAQLVALLLGRLHKRLERSGLALTGVVAGSLAGQMSWTMEDLSVSCDGIRRQQVALGRWARNELPDQAVVGVNDTGAIAYFSERHVFDVVGLTTAGEARYWAAGAGSRFEHYERLGAGALPSHFIVYPQWMAMPELLGSILTERTVTGATILGGTTMVAYEARYDLLRTATRPASATGEIVDELDVADLESEAAHDYALGDAEQRFNQVFSDELLTRADGGRSQRARESFVMQLRPGGRLIARLQGQPDTELTVHLGDHKATTLRFTDVTPWQELSIDVPDSVSGAVPVQLVARQARFSALYYWSVAGP